MDNQWFYSRSGQVCGPVDGQELGRLAAAGQLAGTDLVWREGMADWAQAGSIGLGTTGQSAVLPPPLPATPAPPHISPSGPPLGALPSNKRTARRSPEQRTRDLLITSWLVGAAALLAIVAALVFRSPERTPVATGGSPSNATPSNATPSNATPSNATPSNATPSNATPFPPRVVPAEPPASASQTPLTESPSSKPPADAPPTLPSPLSGSPIPAEPVEKPTTGDGVGAAASTQPSTPTTLKSNPSAPTQRVGYRQDIHRLFQEIDIHRRPAFVMRGINIAQEIRYQVLSRLHLGAVDANGKRKVTQYIEGTRLVAADDLSRAAFADSLEKIKRQQYIFTLNRFHEVIDFQGHEDNRKLIPIEMAANNGVIVTSVIDRDGWRELAELTFFKPGKEMAAGRPWKRQMTHDWGALGGWSGLTTFFRESTASKQGLQPVNFRHEIVYAPPKPDGPPLALGMRIQGAEFRPLQTNGTIQYDSQQERVHSVQELFSVQGALNVQLLGQPVQIELTERQVIGIQVHDENPWQP